MTTSEQLAIEWADATVRNLKDDEMPADAVGRSMIHMVSSVTCKYSSGGGHGRLSATGGAGAGARAGASAVGGARAGPGTGAAAGARWRRRWSDSANAAPTGGGGRGNRRGLCGRLRNLSRWRWRRRATCRKQKNRQPACHHHSHHGTSPR